MKTRSISGLVLATLLLMAAPALRAQDGAQGALAKINQTSVLAGALARLHGPTLAVADFDGDNKADGAVLFDPYPLGDGNFQVELHLTRHTNTGFKFQSSEPSITVEAVDIDHDGDIDLVIEQSLTRKRLQIWINDGKGNFEKGRMEDYPSVVAPIRDRIGSSDRVESPAISLPSQRGFETMLMACHIAGGPPSENKFALSSLILFRPDPALSLAHSRAPPVM